MGIPSSLSHIKGEDIFDTLGLSPQDSQTGEDVVGGIHNGVLHLDGKIERKIHFQAELHQQSQEFEVFASPCSLVHIKMMHSAVVNHLA